jgi:hypothetical protein
MHENCPGFVANETIKVLTHLNIPTMLTSPASFQGLNVEGCFEVLKAASHDTGDFEENDEDLQATRIKTTKKERFMNAI